MGATHIWIFPALFLLFLTSVFAQEVTFTTSVNTENVSLGEQFQVTYTLSGGNLKQHKDFRQPDLNANFLTLMGPSTSQQMQIINGKVSTSISWTFVLQPRNVGSYQIPPASITYDGQTLKSNPLSIKVTVSAPGASQGKKKEEDAPKVQLEDNLFVRAIPDKRNVYIGEPVMVTYKLYSRVAFQLNNPIKLPRMIGFWSEDLETPSQLKPEVETYNGKQYETYTLKKAVYFPTQTGELTIDPFEIDCTVQVRQKRRSGDDFFDRFFSDPFFDSYQNVKKTLMTEKLQINVKALPTEGKPESFRGAVGDFTMQCVIDKKKLKANETASLKVTIRGDGNIKLLEEPLVEFPNGIDHFDPKVNDEIIKSSGRISGVKVFEYLVIPRYAGKKTLTLVEFSYFNVNTKKYITLKSEEFVLDVAEGEGQTASTIPGQNAVNYLALDIKPLKEGSEKSLSKESHEKISLSYLLSMYMLPMLAFFGALMYKRRHDRIHSDVAGLKMRRATRLAEKHLARSRKFLDANNIDAYYLEIARALWGYTQNKLSLPTSETSVQSVIEVLTSRKIEDGAIGKIQSALDATEYARFSPTRASETEMRSLYEKAKNAIIAVEQALRG